MVKPPSFDSKGMKKGAWSEEEDNKLRDYVMRYGHWNWRLLPKYAGLARCGKSCRLRWINHLKPGIKRGNFTKQEEELIIQLHSHLGNKWSAIAAKLPGRTDHEIKNFWYNTRIKRRSCTKQKHQKITLTHDHEETVQINNIIHQNERPDAEHAINVLDHDRVILNTESPEENYSSQSSTMNIDHDDINDDLTCDKSFNSILLEEEPQVINFWNELLALADEADHNKYACVVPTVTFQAAEDHFSNPQIHNNYAIEFSSSNSSFSTASTDFDWITTDQSLISSNSMAESVLDENFWNIDPFVTDSI